MLSTIFSLIIILFSIVLHEIAHGYTAYKLGDPTAKYAGRLTLNPLAHLDPVGSFLVPLFTLVMTLGRGPMFGWAKPVPINPYNFTDQKYGQLKVAIAGPAMNFLVALILGLILKFFALPYIVWSIFSTARILNIYLGAFNLIPIPPLDGSHILSAFLNK
ncbi:MAG: site-2 protease family protein [Candidatus Pacebacteria bacterium]|nr:site-2 protease family protein [Candidatus Paceibacterota bacterium]